MQRLYEDGYWALAGLVLLTSILAPFLRLSAMFYVFGHLYLGRVPWKLAPVFRFLQQLQPWSRQRQRAGRVRASPMLEF